MGCFIGDNNLTRLPSELASPNSGDWTGTGEDGELVIASRMLDSMVLQAGERLFGSAHTRRRRR